MWGCVCVCVCDRALLQMCILKLPGSALGHGVRVLRKWEAVPERLAEDRAELQPEELEQITALF